jgi:hypothetical protein
MPKKGGKKKSKSKQANPDGTSPYTEKGSKKKNGHSLGPAPAHTSKMQAAVQQRKRDILAGKVGAPPICMIADPEDVVGDSSEAQDQYIRNKLSAIMEVSQWKNEGCKGSLKGKNPKLEKAALERQKLLDEQVTTDCVLQVPTEEEDSKTSDEDEKSDDEPETYGQEALDKIPECKAHDYSADSHSGYNQLAPFFRHGKDALDTKRMRMLTPGQVMEDMGEMEFQTLGDALRNFVVNKIFPRASPGDVFRHVLAVHVCNDLPCDQLQQVIGDKIQQISAPEFVMKLLEIDLRDQIRVSVAVSEGKPKGTYCVVVVQGLQDTLDVWRSDNRNSPGHPDILKPLQRRIKKLKRQGRLENFQSPMRPQPTQVKGIPLRIPRRIPLQIACPFTASSGL